MKIVYLSVSTIPSRTANSIHVMKMCQAFAKNGHEVILFAPKNDSAREPGVDDVFSFYGVEKCFKIHYLPLIPIKGKGLLYSFQAAIKIKGILPDLVYGRDLGGCYFSTVWNLPVIFESHAPIEGIVYAWILRRLIKSPMLKKFVVITHALKDYYLEKHPSLSNKIIVAPDGADPIPENVEPIAFPNKGRRLQVGYVGHLYAGRGIEIIIQLAEKCPWADFHIIGGTDQDINTIRTLLSRKINIYLHGFKPPRETEKYRIGCDVLLAPYQKKVSVAGYGATTTERWMSPLKLFEYMAAGKAIICSDIPVLREILEHGRNAYLCPPDNIESWESALMYLSENENIRRQFGENARNVFLNNYSWISRVRNILFAVNHFV